MIQESTYRGASIMVGGDRRDVYAVSFGGVWHHLYHGKMMTTVEEARAFIDEHIDIAPSDGEKPEDSGMYMLQALQRMFEDIPDSQLVHGLPALLQEAARRGLIAYSVFTRSEVKLAAAKFAGYAVTDEQAASVLRAVHETSVMPASHLLDAIWDVIS